MSINGTGNLAGPEGAFVRYDTLAQGDTFAFSPEDVNNGAFFLRLDNGMAAGPNGAVQSVPGDQVVLKVTVNATVIA